MERRAILLGRYSTELSVLWSFYQYSETAFSDQNLFARIVAEKTASFQDITRAFLIDPVEGPELMNKALTDVMPKEVAQDISRGLAILRSQLLVAAHSIFERFLCHVLRVYLHTFPQILKSSEKSVTYRQIVDLAEHEPILDYIVEREIHYFSHKSLQEKKDYFAKRLHVRNTEDIWIYDGDELWKDIDRKRHTIVHGEGVLEISPDYLVRAINYFNRASIVISLDAQVKQGIPFSWGIISSIVRKKEHPEL